MLGNKKFSLALIYFLSLTLNLWSIEPGGIEDSFNGRARTGSELRRRTGSSSGRGDSKGSESEVELTTPSTEPTLKRELLPKSRDILDALVAKDTSQLDSLVARFTSHRLAKLSFPVLIPYGEAGGSSFAIYAVQTKQIAALKILAQVEDFMVPDRLRRTPMSVALELARKDASYSVAITALEELQKVASETR